MRYTSPVAPITPRVHLERVEDAFSGTEEIKVVAPDGHRRMRIEAEANYIDEEYITFHKYWVAKKERERTPLTLIRASV